MRSLARNLSRRTPQIGWGVIDQIASSIGNFALAAFVAHASSEAEFGTFSIAMLIYLTTIGLLRGFLGEPILSTAELGQPELRPRAETIALAMGGLGAVLALTTAAFPVANREYFVIIGIGLPALCLLDCRRYLNFGSSRAGRNVLLDVSWTVSFLVGALVLHSSRRPAVFFIMWCVTAGLAVLLFGGLPDSLRLRRSLAWWRRTHAGVAGRLSLDAVLALAINIITLLVVAAAAGRADLGAIRGAQLVLGPVVPVVVGIQPPAVTRYRRLLENGSSLRSLRQWLFFGPMAIILGWTALTLVIPDHIGRSLLGATWETARTYILPVGLATAAVSAAIPLQVHLRALRHVDVVLRARVWLFVPTIALPGLATLRWGAGGYCWGFVAVSVLQPVLLLWLSRRLSVPAPPMATRPIMHERLP